MKKLQITLSFILILIFFTACNSEDEINTGSNGQIYTTVYPLQFIVEEIAKDTVSVESIYPPGVDEHTFEPTSRDLTNIAEGDALLYIGAGLEAFAETAADALANQDVALVEIGSYESLFIDDEHGHEHEHEDNNMHHGDVDPHLWIDPLRMIEIASIIKNELISFYPDNEDFYNENFVALEDSLNQLDQEFKELLSSKNSKEILVTHAAFGYWEERYDIEQIAIHGISTENEPSQKELIQIIDAANENNIQHIIFEQNVTTNVAKVIQDEVGAEALVIHNLAVLTEEDITDDRDYFSIMRDNLKILDEALD